jgi:hypothetical protein
MLIPIKQLEIDASIWTITDPSGPAILWTARLGYLLLLCGVTTALFYARSERDWRLSVEPPAV